MKDRGFSAGIAVIVASLASLAAARTAAADPGDTPTAVLGLEALEGTPENVATEMTDALRQRVAGTKGYQLIQGKDLVEVKLVYSCADEAPACMAQAGKSLGAAKLIFGNVRRSSSDYLVTLKLLDVSRGVVESWEAETVPKRRAEPSVFRSLAPAWLAKLTGKGTGGTLQVRANVAGAAVSLDGTRVGTTSDQPVAIPDVAPGRHEVAVEKSGYTTTKQEFTLAAGQSLPLSLALSPVSVVPIPGAPAPDEPVMVQRPGPEPEPGSEGGNSHVGRRVGFWVAVGGTVVSAALALKFGNDVRQINQELDPYRRFPCTSSTTGLCDVRGNAAQPLTLDEKNTVASKKDDGSRFQTLQWVFVGLVPPFAIAGGWLLYKGYLEAEGGSKTSSNRGLRIFPTANASARGIIAEFDF
jgi:hypothetical protein